MAATPLTNSTQFNVAANVQANATALFGTLAAGGWTQTADTGQTANGSFPAATAGNQVLGYQIWQPNDSLRTFKVKIEIGSGSSSINPAVWLTIGTGSDGAGNITGVMLARTQLTATGNGNAGLTSYFSASNNRLSFCLAASYQNTAGTLLIVLQRSRDNAGFSEDGVSYLAFGSSAFQTQYLPFDRAARAMQTVVGVSCGAYNPGSLAGPGNKYGLQAIHPQDVTGSMPAGIAAMVYYHPDTAALVPVDVVVAGDTHKYLPLGTATGPVSSPWTSSALAVLYE